MVGGLRFDRFDLQYHNNRNGDTLARLDNLVSPRAGVVFKPVDAAVALRQLQRVVPAELRRSVLVADDDHAAGRSRRSSTTTRWARSGTSRRCLSLTTAVYRLDRTNTRSTDPNDPTRIVQTGSQRTNGYELGVNGQHHAGVERRRRLRVSGCLRDQRDDRGAARARRWRRCRTIRSRSGITIRSIRGSAAGLGVLYRSDMFAAIDNTVTLPGYTRADAAAFFTLTQQAAPSGERRERLRQDGITSMPTATRTSRRDSHGPSGWD